MSGERVRLRSTVPDDRDALCAIRRTVEVQRRWGGVDVEAEFAEDLDDDELSQLTIEVGGRIVGLIQFAEEDEAQYRHASLDIYIDPAVHRHGYAADAIRTLVDHLFDERGHHRLTIDPAVDNHAAIRCYAAVGFRPVGVMRSYERRADGSWGDGLLMELLATERPSGHRSASPPGPGELELRLLRPEVRGDRSALEALLHEDFVEIGASGRLWSRDEIIAALLASPDPGPLVVVDLQTQLVAVDAALVTYRTLSPARSVLRSSLWLAEGDRWRIRFHQGTLTSSS